MVCLITVDAPKTVIFFGASKARTAMHKTLETIPWSWTTVHQCAFGMSQEFFRSLEDQAIKTLELEAKDATHLVVNQMQHQKNPTATQFPLGSTWKMGQQLILIPLLLHSENHI